MTRGLEGTARIGLKAVSAVADSFLGPLPGPRILIYHQVGVSLGREMEVSTEMFVRHLDWIQANGDIVDLDQAIERRGEPGSDSLFVLTFDDGFQDVYYNAFPHMKERGVPFVLYLTTRPIETREPLDPRYPDARPLTWDQVNEMTATGLVTVGAHTHTHPDLRSVSVNQVADEIGVSGEFLRDRTGYSPRHFTYPWGWWSETADPLVRKVYVSATVGSSSPITATTDVAMLGRFPVQASDGLTWFTKRMARGLRLENAIRRWRAGSTGI